MTTGGRNTAFLARDATISSKQDLIGQTENSAKFSANRAERLSNLTHLHYFEVKFNLVTYLSKQKAQKGKYIPGGVRMQGDMQRVTWLFSPSSKNDVIVTMMLFYIKLPYRHLPNPVLSERSLQYPALKFLKHNFSPNSRLLFPKISAFVV